MLLRMTHPTDDAAAIDIAAADAADDGDKTGDAGATRAADDGDGTGDDAQW